jgi:hypothetical protein
MAETQQVLFEWGDPGDGTQQVMYLGKAPIGVGEDDYSWEIKQFTYVFGTDAAYHVAGIKTLFGKPWTDRATLPWA